VTPAGVGRFLRVDDFDIAHERMVAAGVPFVSSPRDELYGRVAMFLDLEGNRWDLKHETCGGSVCAVAAGIRSVQEGATA